MNRMLMLCAAAALLVPARMPAQGVDIEARMQARGVPADIAGQVAAIAADASARGVPEGPLADKAIEGWAKRVPAPRILDAVRAFAGRMESAVQAVRSGGLANPPGQVVAAAAEAMGGGLRAQEVGEVVRAAPSPSAAAPGLSVAAALAAQGLGSGEAVSIVVGAMRNHRSVAELLDLPSVARAMRDEGMSASEIGEHIFGGDGDGHGSSHASTGDHPNIPQGTGSSGHDHVPNVRF